MKCACYKEIIMRSHGQATVWGHQIAVGRVQHRNGWLQQLHDWWMLCKATRRDTKLAALNGCWDAHREVIIPQRAEAASEMAAAHGALSLATQLYGLSV
jgi:hypothetical protein